MYVINEWKKGAVIQAKSSCGDWFNVKNCPSMSIRFTYRVDPKCIIKTPCNKSRTKELLDAIQLAKNELEAME